MDNDSIITQNLRQLAEDVSDDSDSPDHGESIVPTLELKQLLDVDESDDRSDSERLQDLAHELGLDSP